VRQNINLSYYTEKLEELKLLKEQLTEGREGLDILANDHYKNTYCQWRKDVLWLNRYLVKGQFYELPPKFNSCQCVKPFLSMINMRSTSLLMVSPIYYAGLLPGQ